MNWVSLVKSSCMPLLRPRLRFALYYDVRVRDFLSGLTINTLTANLRSSLETNNENEAGLSQRLRQCFTIGITYAAE